MQLVIRLQQHGYKNHPRWYIVVAPKYKNIKGKYLEQVGYWIPRKGKTFDRSIIMNKNRVQYWLGQGAEPTPKVAKFFNVVDLWPAPVVQFGSKSIYDRPEKTLQDSQSLNPYKLKNLKMFLGKVLEQEESSYLFRMAIENQNYLQHFNSENDRLQMITPTQGQDLKDSDSTKDLMTEINSLKEQLDQINISQDKLDQPRQKLLIDRINELYKAWNKEQIKQEFSQIQGQNAFSTEINQSNIKQRLDLQKIGKKFEQFKNIANEHQQMLKPITRDEFRSYLINNGGMTETKAESLMRQAYRTARETGLQVLRQHAFELCQPEKKISNIAEVFLKKNQDIDDKLFIPISKPITPFPDLSTYDPEDYYEIPKMADPLSSQNKPYDLPNINDVYIPKKDVKIKYDFKNVTGRKRPKRLKKTTLYNTAIYNPFSTVNTNQNQNIAIESEIKQQSNQYEGVYFQIKLMQNSCFLN